MYTSNREAGILTSMPIRDNCVIINHAACVFARDEKPKNGYFAELFPQCEFVRIYYAFLTLIYNKDVYMEIANSRLSAGTVEPLIRNASAFCEPRKLRRQAMRIEHRPIHHSRGKWLSVGIARQFVLPRQSIQFRSPYRVRPYDRDNLSDS